MENKMTQNKHPAAVIYIVSVFLSFAPFLSADTLSQAAAATDTGKTGIATATAEKKQPKAVTKSKRDAVLNALLATLEKEDSLNSLSRRDTTATSLQKKNQVKKDGVKKLWQKLVQTTRRYPRPFVVAGVMLCIILIWLVGVRISRKKADKRFMTTTRLSLMDSEVRRACVHIEKHFADPALTPGVVCAAIVTGGPFLEALFQKELGMSIADYIAQTRIHHAKQIVKDNPAAEATAVAVQAGFSNVGLFKTTFEKLTGLAYEDFLK